MCVCVWREGRDEQDLFVYPQQDVADLDHSKFDCLMVAILSHGVNGRLYSTDGDLIPVEDITSYVL